MADKLDLVEQLLNEDKVDSANAIVINLRQDIAGADERNCMRYDMLRVSCMNKMFVSLDAEEDVMKRVVDYYADCGTADERMEACLLLGSVYRDMGDAPLALEWFDRAIECGRVDGDNRTLIAKIHGQKADLFKKQHLFDDALRELELMQGIAESIGNKDLSTNAYSFRSSVLWGMGNYDSVLIVDRDCSEMLMSEYRDTARAAIALASSIACYVEIKDYVNAKRLMDFYEKYSGCFDVYGNIHEGMESYYIDKGEMYKGLNMLDSAENYYRKALAAADWNSRTMGYYGLAEIYKAKSESDSVAKYSMLTCTAYSKYFEELQTNKVQQIEATYNYERYKLDSVEKALEAERTRNVLIIVLASMAVVVCLVLIVWNKWKAKRRLEMEELKGALACSKAETYQILNERKELARLLEEKNEIIESMMGESVGGGTIQQEQVDDLILEICRLNEALEETENKYSDIIEQKRGVVSSLLVKADDRGEWLTDDDWLKLQEYTRTLYPDFFARLKKVLPNIKLETIQIAALVKLDFTPTQVSVLLRKSVQSITNSRRRMYARAHDVEHCSTEEADNWIKSL